MEIAIGTVGAAIICILLYSQRKYFIMAKKFIDIVLNDKFSNISLLEHLNTKKCGRIKVRSHGKCYDLLVPLRSGDERRRAKVITAVFDDDDEIIISHPPMCEFLVSADMIGAKEIVITDVLTEDTKSFVKDEIVSL